VISPPGNSLKRKIFRENQPFLSAGRKFEKLDDFLTVANEMASQHKNCEGAIQVDDIVIAHDTWTITLSKKDISLGPVGSALFTMLVLHAGQPVSRERLRRSVSDLIDPSNLDGHIYTLRAKLGVENRNRIQTVRGVGYLYVSPENSADAALRVQQNSEPNY
jgi:DNA-binding response OmpR family regulator